MKKIIFHHPLPLNPNATSASGIRPLRMLEAFKSLGYQVDVVSGYSNERKRAIKVIKKNIKSGVKYDFVYSESSTMPTVLTDPHHLPLHPLMDFMFFRFCKRNNIKTGLFYRDIYWVFESYSKNLNWVKSTVAKLSYKYELYFYNRYLEKLYLPSMAMGDYIPIVSEKKYVALPPGHDVTKDNVQPVYIINRNDKIKIFYVGGMVGYNMHFLVSVINNRDDIELTICTRLNEWKAVKSEYPALSENIKVIHKVGKEMVQVLQSNHLVSVYIKPEEYRDFAVPFKLFEYLGNRKPVIASQGTLAGKFVSENGIGWTIPYNKNDLNVLLDNLVSNPDLIIDITKKMDEIAENNTWQARAKQVVKDLTC